MAILRRIIFAGVFTLSMTVLLFGEPGPAGAAARYEVSVWYPGWGTSGVSDYDSLRLRSHLIDEVNPYWYALKPGGAVRPYEWAEDPRLLSLARREGIAVMPLVSNEFDPDRVSRMLQSRESRERHARQLVQLAVQNGYDGLDLDYELLRASDRNRFSLFVEDLARRLHARGKQLSVAVHPKTSEPGHWSGARAQDWKRIGQAADKVKIMLYDYHWDGSRAGPAAPLWWIDEVLSFAKTQIAPRKIRMGLPFYAREWRGTSARDLVHADVRRIIDGHSPTIRAHASGERYFNYAGGRTVYFQTPLSIDRKLGVLVDRHPRIGGISVWHIGGEAPGYWNAIRNRLGR